MKCSMLQIELTNLTKKLYLPTALLKVRIAAAESKWQKNLIIFDILLIHDYVDEISVNLSAMRSYVATQSNDNYLAESAGIKKQLTSVKDSELVKIENIL